jgi:hypothetical protein
MNPTQKALKEFRKTITDPKFLQAIKNNPGEDRIYSYDAELENKWDALDINERIILLRYEEILEKKTRTDEEVAEFWDLLEIVIKKDLHTGHIPDHVK